MRFTQYLMPHGHRQRTQIDVAEEIEIMALEVNEAGGEFEAEMLAVPVGMPNVSFTCDYQQEDIAQELAVNGPEVLEAVDNLVRKAHRILVTKVMN